MQRRTVLRTLGGAGAATTTGLAGCLTRNGDEEPPNGPDDDDDPDPEPDDPDLDETLRVVTYRSMVTGSNPAGPWLGEAFEEAYPDADLEWVVPEAGLEQYLRRGTYENEIDADVCLGVTVGDLARIDARVAEGGLLRELNRDRIDGVDRIRDDLAFEDPYGRALAYDTGYVALVYDETAVSAPETFADLADEEYADALLAQQPGTSMPGQAFLLWTIETGGLEEAMTYWAELAERGAQIHRSWTDAYEGAYMNAERPLVVSYSTAPAVAAMNGHDEEGYRVAFLEDQGYALPEGMGIFEAATAPDLAYAFLEFLLTDGAQAELATRNVQFPAVEGVDVDPAFEAAARRPPESVTTSYTELRGSITGWLEAWDERFGDRVVDQGWDRHP